MESEDQIERIIRRLKIKQNIALIGGVVLASAADISVISPHYAEYAAIPGGGVFTAGIIAIVLEFKRLRGIHGYSPEDDPGEEVIETMAEIVEFPQSQTSPIYYEEAA